MHRVLPTVLLFLTACSRAAPAPQPAPSTVALLAAGTSRYALIEHRYVEQRYQGQTLATNQSTTTLLTVRLTPAVGGFALTVTVDSMAAAGDAGVPAEMASASEGAQFVGEMTSLGQVRELTRPDRSNTLLDQLAISLQELLPSLPPGGAYPQTTWTDSTVVRGQAGGVPLTIRAASTHHAGSWTDSAGQWVLHVESITQYSLTGDGMRGAQSLSLAGTGRAHAMRLLTADGAIAFGVQSDTLDVALEIGGTGLIIPVHQLRSDTVRREVR